MSGKFNGRRIEEHDSDNGAWLVGNVVEAPKKMRNAEGRSFQRRGVVLEKHVARLENLR